MKWQIRLCFACGDPAQCTYKGKPACRECFDELVFGIIGCEPVHPYGNTECPCTMEDDGGPWQQNAVRALEDGR